MDALDLLFLVVGGSLGALILYWWQRQSPSVEVGLLKQELERERTQHRTERDEFREESQQLYATINSLSADLAAERERSNALEIRLKEQKGELEEVNQRMTSEFKLIANELLEHKGKQLNEQQKVTLQSVLDPLKERIREFEQQVKKTYQDEERERFALKKEIHMLVEQNIQLSKDADNLSKALKGDSQMQGAWGEMLLEKLLEGSGLVKGEHYRLQESTTLDDGSRLRPDAVVLLPDDKFLVIDSKVSLVHYERFTKATDPDERDKLLKQHVESMRAHAKSLGAKDYRQLYSPQSVDMVFLFVPLEPAFLLALRERPEIFQEAYDRHVIMVTHTTLMATLRTIHGIWKNEHIARNHQDIAARAGELYNKFVGFTDDMKKVGQQLDTSKRTYTDAMKKLSEGTGNLVRQTEMLKELGAKTNKAIDPAYLQRSLEPGNSNAHDA